jgi:polysaccharide export outer membrane protein
MQHTILKKIGQYFIICLWSFGLICSSAHLALASNAENAESAELSSILSELNEMKQEANVSKQKSLSAVRAKEVDAIQTMVNKSIEESESTMRKTSIQQKIQAKRDDPSQEKNDAISGIELNGHINSEPLLAIKPKDIQPALEAKIDESDPNIVMAGDVLDITVYREPDLSGKYNVPPSGLITYPLIGKIQFKDKTLEGVSDDLTAKLREFLVDPQVTVLLLPRDKSLASGTLITITVLGEVKQPGEYEIETGSKLTNTLARAGGLTDKANNKSIKVLRTNEFGISNLVFSLEDIGEGIVEDPIIQKLDKIMIDEEDKDSDTVAILGEINKPGIYKIVKDLTLLRLIAKAGGLSGIADSRKIRIIRKDGEMQNIYEFNLGEILSGRKKDPLIHSADKVYIPESFF